MPSEASPTVLRSRSTNNFCTPQKSQRRDCDVYPTDKDNSPTSTAVFMGETGAEVTIHMCPQEVDSRIDVSVLSESSLLDIDLTPARSSRQSAPTRVLTPDSPQIGQWGIMCCDMKRLAPSPQEQQLVLTEGHIMRMLGSTVNADTVCAGWHMMFFSALRQEKSGDGEQGQEVDEYEYDSRQISSRMRKVMQRRTLNLSQRRTRLEALRRNLSPFQYGEEHFPKIRHSRSFSPETENHAASLRYEKKVAKKPKPKQSFKLFPVWECGTLQCYRPDESSPRTVRVEPEELNYDSDPEDFARTRRSDKPMNTRSSSMKRIPSDFSEFTTDAARDAVQQLFNEKHVFVIYDECNDSSHYAVDLWVERGQIIAEALVSPKLVWSRKTKGMKKLWTFNSKFQLPNEQNSIDLLDIHRILDVEKIDRNKYPFAKRKNCLLIKTVDNTMLLEASSPYEKDAFKKSLKLAVSRLASLLIVSDESLMDEFFLLKEPNRKIGNEDKIFSHRH